MPKLTVQEFVAKLLKISVADVPAAILTPGGVMLRINGFDAEEHLKEKPKMEFWLSLKHEMHEGQDMLMRVGRHIYSVSWDGEKLESQRLTRDT